MIAKSHTIRIALVGNPNSGKSTLFNSLTGLTQKTGNYAGVTVEKHEGKFNYNHTSFSVTDLPGTYSLFPKSLDEEVSCKTILSHAPDKPDVIVIVADSTNLKRHLLLATQLIDLKIPCVLALNMIDEAKKQNITIYKTELENILGIHVVFVDSRKKTGLEELKSKILNAKDSHSIFYHFEKQLNLFPNLKTYKELVELQFNCTDEDSKKIKQFEKEDNISRFHKLNYIIAKCIKKPEQLNKSLTQKLDAVFTHKFFGFIFFFFILFIVFQFVFFIADFPMAWIEKSFAYFMNVTSNVLPNGELNDLIVNGVLAGISGIVVFIPQIALLFLFITVLEDTGYMARASFILDKIMQKFGLNGKSVIPLISSVACAIPSIMSTRTITNWKTRIITILVTPLISCSARLPVYTLIISIMFKDEHMFYGFNYKGIVLMLMYLLGFGMAFLAAFILKLILKSNEKNYFMMELPVYRMPQWQTVFMLVFKKVKLFLFNAGKIILAISIVLWFLVSHGPTDFPVKFKNDPTALKTSQNELNAQKLESSYAGIFGKKIEPLIQPIGFDWKIGIALITSFAAREVFVSTMATIYSSNTSNGNTTLREKLSSQKDLITQKPIYTNAVCWSLLIFYAFAMQCMSTLATTYSETKHWKWPFIQLVFMSILAYGSSFIIFHLLK
ncbi:MAG: ferrous iron transport protein B [Bacteroidota bacterium]